MLTDFSETQMLYRTILILGHIIGHRCECSSKSRTFRSKQYPCDLLVYICLTVLQINQIVTYKYGVTSGFIVSVENLSISLIYNTLLSTLQCTSPTLHEWDYINVHACLRTVLAR